MTVKEYLRGQEINEDGEDLTNTVYVWGVMDALSVFDNTIKDNLGQTLFCVPEGSDALSVNELIEEIDAEIEFARKRIVDFETYTEQTTVGEMAIAVLSRVYSCLPES